MGALLHLTLLSLKLNFRNRMAILYGYLFPLIFLVAFWAIYRNDPVPLVLHLGQLLTVTILGSACFGLPTTIVAERERGVWRRYRLLPARGWVFVVSILAARAVLLLTAALLQLGLAFAFGMPAPMHPLGLFVAFAATAAAFLAFGMVIAMLVDNVPAVQALGQCIFLPMLMIGGVAVRLESLPRWAQHASAFFPGRYAVEALQLSATGAGLSGAGFDLLALLLIAVAGAVAAAAMFRWDKAFTPRRGWLLLALGMWAVVGVMAEARDRVAVSAMQDTRDVGTAKDYVLPPKPAVASAAPASWRDVTGADMQKIAFDRLPPDEGIVSPVSRSDETPDPAILPQLDRIRDALPGWAPGTVSDPVQRARNLLAIAAVPDILQMEQVERFVPRLVFARLQAVIPPRDLPKILYWIALHPDAGSDAAIHRLSVFGLPDISGPTKPVRGRIMLYAFKLLGRLAGPLPNN
ncbi:MAG TPA: ABC transporter permease [Rhizomicrobium sp.]|nr:ABC transporter permease [Rhizomicrobium sp.]